MSKLYGELLVALLITFEILFLSLTVLAARKLWDKIFNLWKFNRLDPKFAGVGNRDDSLYWRRDKVKISFYLALDVLYTAIGLAAAYLVSLGLARVFEILRTTAL